MGKGTYETIDDILEGVVAETEDPDIQYKLNSARQLVEVARSKNVTLDQAITDAVDDREVLDNLSELGYLE